MAKLSKEDAMAFYMIIADKLQQEVEEGTYKEGEKLPSESTLCQRFHANRYTIRQALDRLVKVGLLRSRQGLGYFVTEKPFDISYKVTPVTRYSEVVRQSGREPRADLLSAEQRHPTEHVKEALHLTDEDEVYRLKILRYADDIPIAWNETWLPVNCFPDLLPKLTSFTSLYALLKEHYDIKPKRMNSTFQAVFTSAMEASYLQISPSTPLLQIESKVRDNNNKRIEYTQAKYRGDLCRVSIQFDD